MVQTALANASKVTANYYFYTRSTGTKALLQRPSRSAGLLTVGNDQVPFVVKKGQATVQRGDLVTLRNRMLHLLEQNEITLDQCYAFITALHTQPVILNGEQVAPHFASKKLVNEIFFQIHCRTIKEIPFAEEVAQEP